MQPTKFDYYKTGEQTLLTNLFTGHTFTLVEDYNRWDLIEEEKGYVMEVKIREFDLHTFTASTRYNGNPLIEVDKFWHGWKKANDLGYKFIYVFGFRNAENKIEGYTAYNLQDLFVNEFLEKKLLCPKNSIDPDSEKVWKDCYIINKRLFSGANSRTKKFTAPL